MYFDDLMFIIEAIQFNPLAMDSTAHIATKTYTTSILWENLTIIPPEWTKVSYKLCKATVSRGRNMKH